METPPPTATPFRKIRSFVRRPGRMTLAQRRALEELLPRFDLPPATGHVDLDAVFGRSAPRVLDIGFGDGDALITTAANQPEIDCVGVEVHEPGIGHALLLLEKTALTNVRIVRRDAADVLRESLADGCIDVVNLFFPDPWPKKRHHKRRLVQAEFVAAAARVLKPGGMLHLATDWADYAVHMRETLARSADFVPLDEANLCHNPLAFRPPTKFERRGRRLGHEVVDLFYRRESAPRA